MKELAAYAHPALATVTLFFAYLVFRDGFAQRKQRLRRVTAPAGSWARHVKWAPWSVALMVASAIGGVGSAVFVREWKPLNTVHGWGGLLSTLGFVALWWLGRKLEKGQRDGANAHGVLGLLALFLAGFTGVLGISLLP